MIYSLFRPFLNFFYLVGFLFVCFFPMKEITADVWYLDQCFSCLYNCHIQGRLDILLIYPQCRKKKTKQMLIWFHAVNIFCLDFSRELTNVFSLIFAEDPAVLIIFPVSREATAMCQHTVSFKAGMGCLPSC